MQEINTEIYLKKIRKKRENMEETVQKNYHEAKNSQFNN